MREEASCTCGGARLLFDCGGVLHHHCARKSTTREGASIYLLGHKVSYLVPTPLRHHKSLLLSSTGMRPPPPAQLTARTRNFRSFLRSPFLLFSVFLFTLVGFVPSIGEKPHPQNQAASGSWSTGGFGERERIEREREGLIGPSESDPTS